MPSFFPFNASWREMRLWHGWPCVKQFGTYCIQPRHLWAHLWQCEMFSFRYTVEKITQKGIIISFVLCYCIFNINNLGWKKRYERLLYSSSETVLFILDLIVGAFGAGKAVVYRYVVNTMNFLFYSFGGRSANKQISHSCVSLVQYVKDAHYRW